MVVNALGVVPERFWVRRGQHAKNNIERKEQAGPLLKLCGVLGSSQTTVEVPIGTLDVPNNVNRYWWLSSYSINDISNFEKTGR